MKEREEEREREKREEKRIKFSRIASAKASVIRACRAMQMGRPSTERDLTYFFRAGGK
jgi:hypothetical protein